MSGVFGRLLVSVPANGDGYVWGRSRWDEDGDPREGPVLVERQDRVFDEYAPADAPVALYRELANAEPTEAAVLRFANRYGRLKEDDDSVFDVADVPGADADASSQRYHFHRGEPLRDWVRVIEEMHEAVALWDMARAGDQSSLSEALQRREGRVYYLGTPRYREWRDASIFAKLDRLDDPEERRRFTKLDGFDDPEERRRFRAEVTERLLQADSQGLTKPGDREGDLILPAIRRVMRVINGFVYESNGPQLFWDERRGSPARQDVSANLGGFLWLQFAQAVELQKEPRRCRECGRWFEVARGASRTDRLTCSNTCRTRAYRERQAQAVRLRAEGKTPRQIAKQLSSDEDTVKGWLKASKKKEK